MVSSSLEMSFQKKTSPGWGSGGKRRFHDSEPRGDGPALHPYSWSCCRGLKWVEMHIFTLNKTKPNHQHGHFWAAWLLSQPEVLSWETEHVLVEGEPSCPIRPGEPVVTGGIGQPSPPDQQTDRPEGPRCVQEATAAAGPRLRVLTVKACSLDVAVAPVWRGRDSPGVSRGNKRRHFSPSLSPRHFSGAPQGSHPTSYRPGKTTFFFEGWDGEGGRRLDMME